MVEKMYVISWDTCTYLSVPHSEKEVLVIGGEMHTSICSVLSVDGRSGESVDNCSRRWRHQGLDGKNSESNK